MVYIYVSSPRALLLPKDTRTIAYVELWVGKLDRHTYIVYIVKAKHGSLEENNIQTMIKSASVWT
jgi:hypothetical protein